MAAEALVRRAFVLAGISNTAVNAGGENTAPTRRFMDSSGIRSIDQLSDCNYDDLKSVMINHNKSWAAARQVKNDVRYYGCWHCCAHRVVTSRGIVGQITYPTGGPL